MPQTSRRQFQRLPRRKNARLVAIRLLSLAHVYTVSSQPIGVGDIKLSDGAHLRLKILIVDVKEIGFSPFGGVNFYANVTGGVYIPEPQRARQRQAAIPRPRACQRRLGVARHRRTKARRGAGGRPELAGRICGEGCSRSSNGRQKHALQIANKRAHILGSLAL